MNYTKFLSQRALRRKPSPIRELQPLLSIPGMISLGGGNPTPKFFPISSMSFTLKSGENISLHADQIEKMQQYSPSYGLPDFVKKLKSIQTKEHRLSNRSDWEICVTNGSQDGLYKSFDLLLDQDDYLLVESPTYSGALASLHPIGVNLVEVKSDGDGIDTQQLEKILKSWTFPKKPKAVYVIPTGQNPSGSTLSLERRKHLCNLASQHDFLILEDDPYYFLQFKKREEYLPSLLSLDTEQRVLRFDSFSKIICSGFRIGWVTGPKFLVEKIQIDLQGSCLHASGLSQTVIHAILEKWGESGLESQIDKISQEYKERRNILLKYAEKYLGGLATWNVPSAGMFLWIKLDRIEDSNDLVKNDAVKEKVLFVPGKAFSPNPNVPSNYIRASFSTSTEEQMEEAMKRLAKILTQKK
jgi:kynurenine/2-aminoadipate aminotransferase